MTTGIPLLDYIFNGLLAILLGVVAFFLKRTMTDLDRVREDVDCVKREYATHEDINAVSNEVDRVKLDYTPRSDFEKLENKIDKITDAMHEIQLSSVNKNDFFIKMSEVASMLERMDDKQESTLERMESKIERYRDGK